ncbi:MAG: pyridoxal phosphate-dependent aminotransferase [Deltaproteobacteria bacterium]|nr:pyridoxal phosphate-dependent aminotransferase [Deltaproteobacteria bacterium]MBN2673137.1 pyridoxal phosphate-dependent aminotransferase [Deltaproteobacteria bacterium]
MRMNCFVHMSDFGRRSATPSPVNQMMAQFAADFRDGTDVNLGVGYINERTIPVKKIQESLTALLSEPERFRLPFNYGGPAGTENLTSAIRSYLCSGSFGLSSAVLDKKQLIVGPSGATSLLDSIAQILPRGIVITSDPMYYIYCETLSRRGFEVVAVPEDANGIRLDLLESKLLSLKTRVSEIQFFYVVTVNNPSCTILANERRYELLRLVTALSHMQRRVIPLIFDRAYEDLIHDPRTPAPLSMLPYDDLGVVHEIGTLSKVLAPALRIGYLAAAPSPFLNALVQRTSDMGFSAPVITQELAAVLMERHLDEQLRAVNAGYREKGRAVKKMIEVELGHVLSHLEGGRAGFYYYATFSDVETGPISPFFAYCTRTTGDHRIDGAPLHRRVIYIPGEYCVHPTGDLVKPGKRQLRISYGFEELDQVAAGIAVLREAAKYAVANPCG